MEASRKGMKTEAHSCSVHESFYLHVCAMLVSTEKRCTAKDKGGRPVHRDKEEIQTDRWTGYGTPFSVDTNLGHLEAQFDSVPRLFFRIAEDWTSSL